MAKTLSRFVPPSYSGLSREFAMDRLFTKIVPLRDVRSGGFGAWELAARYSEIDLDDGKIEGGEMRRISVGLNWWATREFKANMQYGWVDLDRFGKSSSTDVFQVRLTFMLGI